MEDFGSFYHLGLYRLAKNFGIESGFIGFNKNNRGYELLRRVIDSFVTKDFRRFERRDDGYVFRKIFEESEDIKKKDVVYSSRESRYDSARELDVVGNGMFGEYIAHRKGMHDQWMI